MTTWKNTLGAIIALTVAAAASTSRGDDLSQKDLQELLKSYSSLSPHEREALKAPVEAALLRLKTKPLSRSVALRISKEVKSANAALPAPKMDLKKDNDIRTELLIRESYAPIAYITLDGNISDNGASFTYTRNLAEKFETFAGNGAVIMVDQFGGIGLARSAQTLDYNKGARWRILHKRAQMRSGRQPTQEWQLVRKHNGIEWIRRGRQCWWRSFDLIANCRKFWS